MSTSNFVLNQRNGLDRIDVLARSVDLAGDLSVKAVTDASSCDLVAVFGFEDVANDAKLKDTYTKSLFERYPLDAAAFADFSGRVKETHLTYSKTQSGKSLRVLLVGAGKWSSFTYASFRSAVHLMFQAVKQLSLTNAAVDLSVINALAVVHPLSKLDVSRLPGIVSRISVMSNHAFSRKIIEQSTHQSINQLSIVLPEHSATDQQQLTDESVIANSVIFAREMINERGDRVTPSELERIAHNVASAHDSLSIQVIKGQGLIDQGLELIRAVGRGSTAAEEPRIVIVEYRGDATSNDKIALVGKG